MTFRRFFVKEKEIVLTLKLEKTQPIELFKLTKAIDSLNQSLNNVCQQQTGAKITLELKNVQSGSDVFNFLVAIPAVLVTYSEFVAVINNYFTLFKNIASIKKQTLEQIQEHPYYTKDLVRDLKNITTLSENANVNITNSFNDIAIYIPCGDTEYMRGLDSISKIKGYDSKEPIKKIYENMMIEFYQTTNTQKDVKHKVYCYDISNEPIPTIISDENLKREMLDNPYNYRFLVDIEVYKQDNIIKNYRAFNYRDKILKG